MISKLKRNLRRKLKLTTTLLSPVWLGFLIGDVSAHYGNEGMILGVLFIIILIFLLVILLS